MNSIAFVVEIIANLFYFFRLQASEHIKKVLGKYYMKDDTPIGRALWRSWSACQFIEDDGDIVFYKNIK